MAANKMDSLLASLMFVWYLLGLSSFTDASDDIYYMARWNDCVRHIDASIQGGRVRSQAHAKYAKEIDCAMTIEAEEGQRILIHFEMFNIPDVHLDECKDVLYVYDGNEINPNKTLTPDGGLCGYELPYDIISASNMATVRFVTNSNEEGEGYDFVFAAITEAWVTHTCPREGDFRCENSYCIDARLQCDGNNNCGDGTDESNSLYEANCPLPWTDILGNILRLGNAAIVGILALLVLLVISFICLIACCCRKNRCGCGTSRKKRYMKYSQAVRGEIAGSTLQYQHVKTKTKKNDAQQSTLRSYTPAIMEGGFLGEDFLKGGRRQSREVYRPIGEDSFPQLPTPCNTPVEGAQQKECVSPSHLQDSNISAMLTSLEKQQQREAKEEHDCHDV